MEIGKFLIFFGLVLVAAGLAIVFLGRMHFPLGRLPGDFFYRGKRMTIYFPLVSSILISVVLSILVYFISRWRR